LLGSPALRWALVEAAQKCTTGGGPLRAQFERITKRRGRKVANPFILLEPLRKIRDLDYDHQRHDCTAVSGLWEPFPRRPYATVGWGDAQVRSAMVRTSAERRDSLA
jgi:hypothetical protein